MYKYTKHIAAAAIACLAMSGCIRDEIGPCPRLSVEISIKDRAYANATLVGYDDPLATTTQFKDLVPTLYYTLRDVSTGEVVRENPLSAVTHSNGTHTIDFDEDLPFGKYALTIWGAVADITEIGDDPNTCDLTALRHPVFVTDEAIDFNYKFETISSELERGTGLVIVETLWDTFPENINASDETFTGLTRTLDSNLGYSGEQDMMLSHLHTVSTEMKTESVLPPSVKEDGTRLHLRFYDTARPDLDGIRPEPIKLTVRRNEVTRLKLSYSLYSESIVIEMMVNGRWQQVNGMKVD